MARTATCRENLDMKIPNCGWILATSAKGQEVKNLIRFNISIFVFPDYHLRGLRFLFAVNSAPVAIAAD